MVDKIPFLIFVLVSSALAAVFVVPVIRFIERNQGLLLIPPVGVFVIAAFFPDSTIPPISLGSINIYPLDLYCPLLLIMAFPFLYSRMKRGFCREDTLLLLFIAGSILVSLNYLAGLKEFGLQRATNEFRGSLYVLTLGIYVSTVDASVVWRAIERYWLGASVVLFIVAVIGLSDGDLSRAGRPLDSTQALFLLQAMVIALFMYQQKRLSPLLTLFSFSLFPMVIILQHRSVWVVSLFTLVCIFWLLPRTRGVLIKCGTIGILVFLSVAATFFGEELFEALSSSYQEAVSGNTEKNTSTLVWRLQTWTGLITGGQMDSMRQVLLGNPYGTGWERVVITSDGLEEVRDESPHNYYLQTALRSGVLGLLVLLFLHFSLLSRLFKWAILLPHLQLNLLCLFMLISSQMVYYLVYGSDYIQGILLGAGIAWIRQIEHDATT